MPKREDERFRNIEEHPSNCRCPECYKLNFNKSSGEPFGEEEWDWVKISGDCPYCPS
jgi:Zn finger protein HypA/HybF involved in hydrogenase expression